MIGCRRKIWVWGIEREKVAGWSRVRNGSGVRTRFVVENSIDWWENDAWCVWGCGEGKIWTGMRGWWLAWDGWYGGAMGAGVSSSGRAASITPDSVDFTIMEGSSVSWRFVDDLLWLPFSKVSSHSVQDLHSLCPVLKQFPLTLCTSLIKVKGSFRIHNDTGDSRIMHMIVMMSLQKCEKETQQQVLQRPSEESERERASMVAWRPGDGGGSSPPVSFKDSFVCSISFSSSSTSFYSMEVIFWLTWQIIVNHKRSLLIIDTTR